MTTLFRPILKKYLHMCNIRGKTWYKRTNSSRFLLICQVTLDHKFCKTFHQMAITNNHLIQTPSPNSYLGIEITSCPVKVKIV